MDITEKLDVCLGEKATLVGHIFYSAQGNRETTRFSYAESWLQHPNAIALSPSLPLSPQSYFHRKDPSDRHSSAFSGVFADALPDAWGRAIIALERKRRASGRPTIDLDYLAGVDDPLRFGALRFRNDQGRFLRQPTETGSAAPRIVTLPRLLAASEAVGRKAAKDADLQALIGPGSSLGGARPKCVIATADGRQAIAKFAMPGEDGVTVRAEIMALQLARAVGIETPAAKVVLAAKRPVGLIERFDRGVGNGRIHAFSAQTLIDAPQAAGGCYRDIAQALSEHGDDPRRECRALFQRMAFTVLVSNCDDHLRNHAVMEASLGRYRLTPAYDINPEPDRVPQVKTELARGSGSEASLAALLEDPQDFMLSPQQARNEVKRIAAAISHQWRDIAARNGLTPRDVKHYEGAFGHDEAQKAIRLAEPVAISPARPKGRGGIGD